MPEVRKGSAPSTDEAEEHELALLRALESAMKEAEKARLQLHFLQESASYKIGHLIVQALKRPRRALTLPSDLFKILRGGLPEDQPLTSASARRARLPRWFLQRNPQWAVFEAVPGQRYRISGQINSARGRNETGALLLLQFTDGESRTIPFEDCVFSWHPKKAQAYCFLTTGKGCHFSVDITIPEGAVKFRLGFERLTERPPIYLEFSSVQELPGQTKQSAPNGVTRIDPRSRGMASALEISHDERKPTLGTILDEFTHDCFAPDVNLVPISRNEWQDEISGRELFAFFAESAWRGNGDQWRYAMTKPKQWGQELESIINWCKSNNTPTVFWNKEDPVNFDIFKETARKFEYIFTTDSGSVDAYRRLVNHDRVHTLAFAAQPLIHNPVRNAPRINRFAFTGSWRGIKYPQRAEWLELLLTPIMNRGLLDIFDRYAGENDNQDLIFPSKFQPAIKGTLNYSDVISDVYKRYLAFVNVNSVGDSGTMLARRVFEILACGAPIISSPSPAIEKLFGDVVSIASGKSDVEDTVEKFINQPLFRDRQSVRGVRLVHSQHTYRHRLEEISTVIGKPLVLRKRRKVSILCSLQNPLLLGQLASQVIKQLYEEKEIVFAVRSPELSEEKIAGAFAHSKDLKIIRLSSEKTLEDGLIAAITASTGDVLAKFDEGDHYGPQYLIDAMLAFDYAPKAGVVGKKSYFEYIERENKTILRFPGDCYQFTSNLHSGTLVWDRDKTKGISFATEKRGSDGEFFFTCARSHVAILSIDPFNYIHVRQAAPLDDAREFGNDTIDTMITDVGSGLRLDDVFV